MAQMALAKYLHKHTNCTELTVSGCVILLQLVSLFFFIAAFFKRNTNSNYARKKLHLAGKKDKTTLEKININLGAMHKKVNKQSQN